MNKTYTIAVIGSRSLEDKSLIWNYLDKKREIINKIISGNAKGADRFAQEFAINNEIDCLIIPPKYKKHGKIAPLVRNKIIVENAEWVIAFWDKKSTGTLHAINYAKKLKKPVKIIPFNPKKEEVQENV